MGIAWVYGPVTCKKLYLAGVDMALQEERAEAARIRLERTNSSNSQRGGGGGEGGGGEGGGAEGDAELSVLEILVRHARKDILTDSQVRIIRTPRFPRVRSRRARGQGARAAVRAAYQSVCVRTCLGSKRQHSLEGDAQCDETLKR